MTSTNGLGLHKAGTVSCAVSLAVNRRRFCLSDVCRVYEPTDDIAGRAGGLRLRRPGQFDLCTLCLYLPATVKQDSQRQAVCSVWAW
eukprot:2238234-Heterocapsa_arctica.AAC.1